MKSLGQFARLNVVALIVVAAWFRGHDLGNLPGVNGDEAWYGVQAELVLQGEPISWRTPTGNLLNPLFFGPQLLLHALFEPSFAVLRTTAVASGLVALAVNFWLCRSVFGRRAALISTAILAVLPINIVYSRLAWDSSQSLLTTLPAIYLPLGAIINPKRRVRLSAWGLAMLAAAIVVHPTNLFVGPVAGICLALAWRDELFRLWRQSFGKAGALIVGVGAIGAIGLLTSQRFPMDLDRLTDPADYAAFAVNLGRLFSGLTVYEYVSGANAPSTSGNFAAGFLPYDVATGLAVVLLGWAICMFLADARPIKHGNAEGGESAAKEDRRPTRGRSALAGLAMGWCLSLAAFFVIAGPAAIAPHLERYGMCLIGPGAILAALAIGWWLDRPGGVGSIAVAVSIAAGWALLASFQANFFDYFHQTGGQSHRTFRTAAIEPKQAAFDYVVDHSDSGHDICVLTTEWWNYWPLRYLSLGPSDPSRPRKIVVEQYTELSRLVPAGSRSAEPIWIVEFAQSPACEEVRRWSRANEIRLTETTVRDWVGRQLLCVFKADGQRTEN